MTLRFPRQSVGVWLLAASAGFLAVYAAGLLLQPGEVYLRLQSNILYNIPGLVALILVARRIQTSTDAARWGWLLVALMLVSWQIGDWIYSVYDLGMGQEPPYPSVADALYTVGYAAILVALLLLAYPPQLAASLRWVLDVVLITTVAFCFEWVLIIQPILDDGSMGSWASMIALSYPLWDLALVTIIVGGVFASHGNLTARSAVLLLAVSLLAVTDTLYSVGVMESGYENVGNPLEIGWILVYILIGAAAILPSRTETATFERRLPFVWLNLPYVLALPLPIVQAVRATAGGDVDVLTLGAAAVLLVAFLSHVHGSYMTTRALDDERRRARLDSLTGTLNHGGIIEEAEALIAVEPNLGLCVGLVDVDSLKRLNDEYGHRVGDQALKVIASRLRRSGGIVGRYGGDEFLVLFGPHDCLDGRDPESLLAQALTDAFIQVGPDDQQPISASYGLALYPSEGRDLGSLVERADGAMYAQKRRKRWATRPPGVPQSDSSGAAARQQAS
jgi:diguanylate cyclase (GGDEF)-like protein